MEIGNIINKGIDIAEGHARELFGLDQDISLQRMKICKKCPLYTIKLGQEICNNKLYLNTATGDVSTNQKEGYKRGCGCRLQAKTRLAKSVCPLGKW